MRLVGEGDCPLTRTTLPGVTPGSGSPLVDVIGDCRLYRLVPKCAAILQPQGLEVFPELFDLVADVVATPVSKDRVGDGSGSLLSFRDREVLVSGHPRAKWQTERLEVIA